MCCILCEEPVRSITLGLAAVGIVSVVNGARRLFTRNADACESRPSSDRAVEVAAGETAS